jgi:hypothetical protein
MKPDNGMRPLALVNLQKTVDYKEAPIANIQNTLLDGQLIEE